MEVNVTLEDIAKAMIANSSHADISDDSKACYYNVAFNENGELYNSKKDTQPIVFETTAFIDERVYEEWLGVDDVIEFVTDDDAYEFLDRFDDWEGLHSISFKKSAEDILEQARAFFADM